MTKAKATKKADARLTSPWVIEISIHRRGEKGIKHFVPAKSRKDAMEEGIAWLRRQAKMPDADEA